MSRVIRGFLILIDLRAEVQRSREFRNVVGRPITIPDMRKDDRFNTIAALTCALAFMTVGGDATRLLASSFIRPVAITNWTPETDAKRLSPWLLANLSVAICDDHFPAGSLARTQIEEGLELFQANGTSITIT